MIASSSVQVAPVVRAMKRGRLQAGCNDSQSGYECSKETVVQRRRPRGGLWRSSCCHKGERRTLANDQLVSFSALDHSGRCEGPNVGAIVHSGVGGLLEWIPSEGGQRRRQECASGSLA